MTDTLVASRLPELLDLARQSDSAARRTLLRELTDAFFGGTEVKAVEKDLCGAVLGDLTRAMEVEVRAEIARRFSSHGNAWRRKPMRACSVCILPGSTSNGWSMAAHSRCTQAGARLTSPAMKSRAAPTHRKPACGTRSAKAAASRNEMNAPMVIMSPCAKWAKRRMPNTSVTPMAPSA